MTQIVLTYGKPQLFNMNHLDTFHTHVHEVNSIFFVLEDCVDNFDENQALALFQKKTGIVFWKESLQWEGQMRMKIGKP